MLLKLLKTILTKINIMKPDSSTIQKASGNFNSSITQVTVTYNAMTEQQMTDLCLRLIDEKLQPLREDARNTLRLLISEFSCELFERIGKLEGNLNSATLLFNFIYKFLSNKKLLRILPCLFFTYLSVAIQNKRKS